jgi:hypothetical protein
MAEHLAQIFGTEKDRVNCPFYFKVRRPRLIPSRSDVSTFGTRLAGVACQDRPDIRFA